VSLKIVIQNLKWKNKFSLVFFWISFQLKKSRC